MTISEGKLLIEQKADDFSKNEKQYLSKTFQGTEVRTRFIDPYFQALGWDFNQTNISKHLWDVHREYSQKDNSNTKNRIMLLIYMEDLKKYGGHITVRRI